MENTQKKNDILSKIKENYLNLNRVLENELQMMTTHQGLTGGGRENFWEQYFRKIIPQKFTLEHNIIIMDSEGHFSREVDLAVIDCQYTPFVFNYGQFKFVPIEAVSVVIECKSTDPKTKQLKEWRDSIKALRTNPGGVARMFNGLETGLGNVSQTSTRPITILASMKTYASKGVSETLGEVFDIILYFEKETGDAQEAKVNYYMRCEDNSIEWWRHELNVGKSSSKDGSFLVKRGRDSETSKKQLENLFETVTEAEGSRFEVYTKLSALKVPGNPLLSLNFQLNQLLMLINNPMLFPHYAYAKLFKGEFEEKDNTCTQE